MLDILLYPIVQTRRYHDIPLQNVVTLKPGSEVTQKVAHFDRLGMVSY